MAQTVVKDSQLRLDPIISQDPQVSGTSPAWELRETDQALPTGLWRFLLSGDLLIFNKNTAVAGDFGTNVTILQLQSDRIIAGKQLLLAAGEVSPANGALLQSVASVNRIVYRGGSDATTHTILFQDDVITRETPTGALNGVNVTYTLANTPVSGSEEVFLNGVLQEPGGSDDYTISGLTITYNTAPLSTDRLRVSYLKS